jgi:hypothetical protein
VRGRFAIFALLSPAAWGATTSTADVASGEPLPPLSLSDAEWMTDRAQLALERGAGTEGPGDLHLAQAMVQGVIDYVQLSSQRRASLTEYEFHWLGKSAIDSIGTPVDFQLTLEEPLPLVQALALEVTRAPVRVEEIRIEGPHDELVGNLKPGLLLDPDIPGRSFLYLPEPNTVRRVTVVVVTESDARPRVKVWLGQAPQPEYLRQALYHLSEARGALEQQNADRAVAELEQARRQIALAQEHSAP